MSSGMDWVCKKMRRSPRLTGWAPASELLGVELVGAKGGCSRDRARCFGPVWLESCKFREVLQRVTNGRSGVGGLDPHARRGCPRIRFKLVPSNTCVAASAVRDYRAWWEAKLQPRSSPQPLLRDVCLPTRPLKDLDFYHCGDNVRGWRRIGLPRFESG